MGHQDFWDKVLTVPSGTVDARTDDERFRDRVSGIADEAVDLLLKKHADYGPKNIADAPGGAMNGIVVRTYDKIARLANLTEREVDGPANFESVEDTLIDIANYAIIGLMVQRGFWPGTEDK